MERYTYIYKHFGSNPGPGSECKRCSRPERLVGGREAAGGGPAATGAKGGTEEGPPPGAAGRPRGAVSRRAEQVRPASRGRRWARRGAGPASPRRGAGPSLGAPGRCGARRVDGSARGPGHQGVRPPPGPAFPAKVWPIREALTSGWAQPAQLLRGPGMVTFSCGGGGARAIPERPPRPRGRGQGGGEAAGGTRDPEGGPGT